MSKVVRKLRGYEKDGDDLVVEYELPPLELSYLQGLFGLEDNNPMFDAYEVRKEHWAELQNYLNQSIDWEGYGFFVE